MLDNPHITDTAVQQTAVIRFTIPREEIQKVMGPAFQEVMDAVAAQGLVPAGAFFSHHFRMDAKIFDFEVGVPVHARITAAGRVLASQLPATRVATAVYRGPYEGLGQAWGEFSDWIVAQGLQPADDLWEVYAAGPETGPDSANWSTEFYKPLKP